MSSNNNLPDEGLRAKTIDFKNDVLPDPDGPITATCSPL